MASAQMMLHATDETRPPPATAANGYESNNGIVHTHIELSLIVLRGEIIIIIMMDGSRPRRQRMVDLHFAADDAVHVIAVQVTHETGYRAQMKFDFSTCCFHSKRK